MIRLAAGGHWRCVATALAFIATLALPLASGAQSVRLSGSTSIRYVEVRPLAPDSLPADLVGGTDLLRQMPDGRVMRCIIGDPFCRGMRPADPVSTVPVMQDLEMSVWGMGEGIHAYAQLRGRTALGGNPELWPRAEDAVDLLIAYGEVDRDHFRVRLGRQWKVSGLGFYNFDGVALAARPNSSMALEGYLGRSLVRGLNEPRTGGALQAIEPLAPVEPGVLLGLQARYRPGSNAAFSALYHRDIRRDRAGLYAELAAADAIVRIGGGSIEGSLEADVAAGALNEARLRVRPAPFRQVSLSGEVRRYRPYFELWTIWGAFAPVGYDEARLNATTARSAGRVILRGEAAYRTYEDPGMTGSFDLFRTDGWALGGGASWAPAADWRMEGSYRMEVGFGAARSEGSVSAVRHLGEGGFVALRGLGFQRLYEFRLEEGTVFGLGVDASLRLSERTRLAGGVTGYRHLFSGEAPDMDWNQLRGNLLLQWTIGAEPQAPSGIGGVR
jgi:hypothetical protein